MKQGLRASARAHWLVEGKRLFLSWKPSTEVLLALVLCEMQIVSSYTAIHFLKRRKNVFKNCLLILTLLEFRLLFYNMDNPKN